MIATPDSSQPHSGDVLPNSRRVYLPGLLHLDLRVPMREIALSPTRTFNGSLEVNEPVRVYDCSGPWGDPEFKGSVNDGLPPLRRDWILKR
ncbi:MAG TPA: phosphomethylpyrimidine synthase, partial [Verrucomicrobiae bacterium]|nr:phosphomethylpyrimidine synthase [Verrucomicrobiae bacterium]